ncbi:MAG: flagellar assembly peptidoglycan hydrolase FlgJ [Thiohalomonadaceae bacterium]
MSAHGINDASVYTDLTGLTRLRADARQNSPAALKAAAQQFEALFLQMMLKSMRDAGDVTGNALFGSDQEQLYRDMHDKQLALEMANGKGLGLADMLIRQLQGAVEHSVPMAQRGERQASAIPERQAFTAVDPASTVPPTTPAVSSQTDPVHFEHPDDFVRHLWPHARMAAQKLGVDPKALLAQAALETGWGRAVIRRPDGSSSHNLFNIKADVRWDGGRVFKDTVEYRDGIASHERAAFRAYGSYAESFEDYVNFLQSSPRYQRALELAADPEAYVRELQEAGYATDPAYADKIHRIMGRDLLADAGLKNGPDETIS